MNELKVKLQSAQVSARGCDELGAWSDEIPILCMRDVNELFLRRDRVARRKDIPRLRVHKDERGRASRDA